MAWGTAKSNIRKKIAAGSFQKPDDTLQRGIMEAGDLAVAKILQREEEAKEEAKRKAAEARELAKEQKAKELAAKNRERKAKALAEDLGANPNNSEAIAYFTEQLFFFDDDTKAAYDKAESDQKKGKIKFVPKEEELFLQGPDVPEDFKVGIKVGDNTLDKFNSGDPITVGDLASISENEGNSERVRTEAAQMADIFAPVSQEPSKTNTFEGLEINADAQEPFDLDYSRLESLESIRLLEQEIAGKNVTLTKEQQTAITTTKELLEGKRIDAAIELAATSQEEAERLERTLKANDKTDTDEYEKISGIAQSFRDGNPPWKSLVEDIAGKDLAALESAKRQALLLGAPNDKLNLLDAEITALQAEESEVKSDELRDTRRGFVTQGLDQLKSIANLTTFDTYTKEEVNLAKEIVETRTNADAADKLKEFKRDLVGKSKEELIQISKGEGFTLLEKVAARAYIASFPEEFDITKYDDVETSTIQTIIAAKGTDAKVITQLSALVANRELGQDVIDPQSDDYVVTYEDKNGDLQVTTAKLAKDGKTYIDLSNPTNKITPAENTNVTNLAQSDALYDNVIKINQSLIKPLKEQRTAMQTALLSAKKLDDLVNPDVGGDPAILTTLGGTLPQLMQRVGLETAALVTLFDQTGSKQSVFDAIDQAFSSIPNVDEAAQKAILFNAEKLKLAFSFAAAQGQTGVGLSNKDFANALTIISSGRDYDTFTKNIRSQMNQVILKTEGMIQDFREDESVKLLSPFDPTGKLFDGYTQSAEQYAKTRGVGDAYAWAKGGVGKPSLQDFLVKARVANPTASDQELTDFYNNKYGNP
jgi:hypothetical protein